ncbi:unnamed protein product, partial [Didymodactylos carnosus]
LGVAPLADNHPNDKYYYQIIVFTGHRRNARTKSKVYLIVSGDNDHTDIRPLDDSKRKIFQRGSIDAFVMSVPKPLGVLNYIRIWHDNSVDGWFLKYIIVRDLQTNDNFHFICQQWLAIEKNDGSVDKLLWIASEEEKQQFSHVLQKKATQTMNDDHLWFSIFLRSTSILYYDQKNEAADTNGWTLGPFRFSKEQIGVSLVVDLLAVAPGILLLELFRRIKPRPTEKVDITDSSSRKNGSLNGIGT